MKPFYFTLLLSSPALAEWSLDPTLHLNAVVGQTSADDYGEISTHGHDPNNDFALQGLEVGLNLRYHDWFAAYANVNTFTTSTHELEAEWEEGFVKFIAEDAGLELRAGRYLNRIGLQNHRHLHSWDYVNSDLSNTQFLGEEGLFTEGAEITWSKDFDSGFFAITGSYGQAVQHSHEEHEDEGEEHGDIDEHGHNEGGESAYFTDDIFTTRALLGYNHTDFHQHRVGLNLAMGENGFGPGSDTDLYSIDYVYTWRENGLDAGGREISFGLEYYSRDVDWVHPENAANIGTTGQSGFMATVSYTFNENWKTSLRYERIQGVEAGPEIDAGEIEYAFATEDRDRISLALTHFFSPDDNNDLTTRLQYNHDDLEEGSEDSVWLQFGWTFGGPEVR